MNDTASVQRDNRGDWRPANPVTLAPINIWPPQPKLVIAWMFGSPGYLWPYNALWFFVAVVTWVFLTPELQAMQSLEAWWVGALLARNAVFILLLFGGLHLYLYVFRGQGEKFRFTSRPFAIGNTRFRLKHQVRDNMFHTLLLGVPIFTTYEVITYWGFANGVLGYGISSSIGAGFWIWAALLFLLAPMIHSIHFYFGHRLLHTKLLYRRFHALHHSNVDIGPWSGLSMHPLEHAIYFSTVVVQWLLALHPVNALFQIQQAAFLPALSHCGFDRVVIGENRTLEGGSHFHNLHHKHFECNYGGSLVPLDRMFGTFHDGTVEADAAMRERLQTRRQMLREVPTA